MNTLKEVPEQNDTPRKDTLRLFISLPLQPEVKQALVEVQTYLSPSFFKPLPKENFHLTLAFLGDTRVTDIPTLEHILNETANRTSSFPCVLSGLGAFPNPWEPRVVWVGIDVGSKESLVLSDTVRTYLRKAGVAFDTKPFRPHITIAYTRKNLSRQELREAGEAFSNVLKRLGLMKQRGQGEEPLAALPRLQVRMEEVALVKSELRSDGAVHTPIHIARFQGVQG